MIFYDVEICKVAASVTVASFMNYSLNDWLYSSRSYCGANLVVMVTVVV